MSDLSRRFGRSRDVRTRDPRQVLKAGAVGAGASLLPLPWTAAATPARRRRRRCSPPTTWRSGTTRAPAPTGCARCRSATDASAPWCSATSTWNGCSSTRTPSGPAARTTRATPAAPARWRRSGSWSSPNQWSQAQNLIDQNMLGIPAGAAGLPDRRQPAADLRRRPAGYRDYNRYLDLTTATTAVTYLQNGVRYRREVFASAPDQVIAVRLTADRAGSITLLRHVRQPAAHDGVQPGRHDRRARRHLRRPARARRHGPVPRAGPGRRHGRHASAAPAARCRFRSPTA